MSAEDLAGAGFRWASPSLAGASTIGLSIFLAVYHYQAASRIGEALKEVEAHRLQVNQMAAQLAFDHGQAICEQGEIAQGVLWQPRGLKSASLRA